MMPAVRTLLAGASCCTIAASAWLAAMALVQHRAGYLALVGLALLFVLQSILTIGVISGHLTGQGVRVVLAAGATGIVASGGRAIAVNLARPHFEGYAVIIGVVLILQGLLTLWSLYVRRLPSLGRTAPIW
jgi:hypothetical protein